MNSRRHAESGFTLPELLIVLAVAGILAAIAVPSFQSLTQSQQVKNASFELFSNLSLARSEAIKRNANVTVAPLVAGDWGQGWAITSAGGESIRSQAALKGVSIVPGGAGSVVYARNGRASPAASFQIDASTGATSNIRCIQIDLSGLPRAKKAAC
ncbi:MAG: GspH/FimT family pseudopilin [Gallionella sp.]|nr:GspH/FimT family pseudopilin [Gallionella sp.]